MASDLIYIDGRCVPSAKATVPVASAGVKYGANVFEGLCLYMSADGARNVFRLREHLERLHQSIKIMRIESSYTDADFETAIAGALRANQTARDAHIRLSVIIVGEGRYDVRGPTSLVCTVAERPPGGLEDIAVTACISSWRRIDDQTLPPRIKAGANYHNSRFALLEAQENGYDEALLLNASGKVSEATSACFMMFRKGALITPPVTAGILESVTRDTMLRLAHDEMGMPVEVREIDRTEIYTADEAFFCNSFEEVRPVTALDRLPIGSGAVGPTTKRLWDTYENVVRSADSKYTDWLSAIEE